MVSAWASRRRYISLTPELVESLILVNTFSYVPFFMRDYVLKQWKDTLASMDDETYIKSSARACLHSDDPDKLRMAEKSFRIDDREIFLRRATDAVIPTTCQCCPLCDVPTLVIGCRHDKVVPLICTVVYNIWITGSRFVMLDGGHLSILMAARVQRCSARFRVLSWHGKSFVVYKVD